MFRPVQTLREAHWREAVEHAVRTFFVVQMPPALRDQPHLLYAVEDARVEPP